MKTHLQKLRASIEQMKEVNAEMQITNAAMKLRGTVSEWEKFYEATKHFRQFVGVIVFLGSGRRE